MENCNCSCRYLFIIAFNVGGDSGLAMVSAERDSEAIQILRNSGKYNGYPLDYVIRDYKKLGEIPNVRSELLLESYNNALGAYELLESTVKWLKGDKGDKGDTVVGAPAGFGNITATVDSNVGIPSVEVVVWGPDTAKNFTFNFHNLKGGEGSGGGSSTWGNIGGDINDQTDLITALNKKLNKISNPVAGNLVQLDSNGNLVNSGKSVNDFIEQESDPTVPSWAKQQNKPTYNYSEILNSPTIPTALADLSDDSTHRLVTDADKTTWSGKQAALESGVNIKTINGDSILGEGNLVIQGGGGGSTVSWGTPGADYVPLNVDGVSKNLLTSHQSITGKADKVSNATSGHLAGLDSNGNLTDSGNSPSDFATATQGGKADTAYQKPGTGIPKTDLSSAVQASLDKADSALQSFTETDPTVPAWAKASTKPTYDYSEIQNTPSVAEITDYTDAELQTAIDTAFANL